MIVGHRWQYSYDLRWYKCVPLPFGGVESHQWCVGCGAIVTDMDLCESGFPRPEEYTDRYVSGVYLDILARGKGKETVEAGTYKEFKLRQGKYANL